MCARWAGICSAVPRWTEAGKAALLGELPRVANVSLSQFVAELGPLLERCENAANKPARVAITGFADNSRHSSAWAAERYRQARTRGARHPHAERVIARGWIRVIWACWHTDTPYHPSRHRGEQLAARNDLT